MNPRSSSYSGFVLLEILPAMLLFSTCLLLGTRLFWVHLRLETAIWRQSEVESGFLHTWKIWQTGGGSAAVAIKESGEGWKIYDFPNDSWLPEEIGTGAVDNTGRQVIFRKRLIDDTLGLAYWDVDIMTGQVNGGSRWRWYRRIYEQPLILPRETDP